MFEFFALVASPEYTRLVFLYFLLWSTTFYEVCLVFLLKPSALIKRQLDTFKSTSSLTAGILRSWTYTETNSISWMDVYFRVK